jgi:hypothetical protein
MKSWLEMKDQKPATSDWLGMKTVPETDTGGRDEYSKALERMVLKELGKLIP